MLIAQLTDLHVRPVGKPASRVAETNMLTARALRALASFTPRADVLLLTGDLTECGLDAEYIHLAQMLRRFVSIPVFAIPGNHDRRGPFREQLAHLPGVTSDPHYVQYAIDDYPVRLVMLDTLVPGAGHGDLRGEQLEWLDRTLAAVPDKPTLIGMHHPPFVCGIAHMDRIALRNREAFAEVIARHRQVDRIVCGHNHRSIVARLGPAIVSIAPSVAHQAELALGPRDPAAFMLEPPAFQLHRWTPDDGFVTHTAFVEQYPGPFPFINEPEYPGAAAPPASG